MTARPTITYPAPGIIQVLLAHAGDTTPEALQEMASEVIRMGSIDKVVIVAEFRASVATVDVRVIKQWIEIIGRKDLKIVGAAIVTSSTLVRLAAQSVGLGAQVRGSRMVVKAFSELLEGITWSRGLISGAKV